jgi:hypothetical protein
MTPFLHAAELMEMWAFKVTISLAMDGKNGKSTRKEGVLDGVSQ